MTITEAKEAMARGLTLDEAFAESQNKGLTLQQNKNNAKLPAGKYYIGDLRYVMDFEKEWMEVFNLTFDADCSGEKVFTLKDGRKFGYLSTFLGDGTFPTNIGATIFVDSGTIGCIRLSDISVPVTNKVKTGSALVTFKKPFKIWREGGKHQVLKEGEWGNGGILHFGRVAIDTTANYWDWSEWDAMNDDGTMKAK